MKVSIKIERASLLGSRQIRAQPSCLRGLGVRCVNGDEVPPSPLAFRSKGQPLHPGSLRMQCYYLDWKLLFLFLCRFLESWDISLNPGPPRRQVKDCRVLCANIRGLHCNLKQLTAESNDYDILLLSETLVTSRRHTAELGISGFGKPHMTV